MQDGPMRKFSGIYKNASCCVGLAFLCILFESTVLAEPLKIGVLAYRSKDYIQKQYQPLADILNQAIPDCEFSVEAMGYEELEQAVATRQIDFILTNPSHYWLMAYRSGLSAPLATLVKSEGGQALSAFGGVIFTLADREELRHLSDLRGKTVAVATTRSLGGYQMQAHELMKNNLYAGQDFKPLVTGMPHDRVIEAVFNGDAEVGFVRSGVLESMAVQGKLDLARVHVLNSQDLPDFPAAISTRLFPEWPIASLPHINETLARRVVAALFLLTDNPEVTRQLAIRGFTIPADYTAVADLLRDLRLPPFDSPPRFTLEDVWRRYSLQIFAVLVIAVLISLLSLSLWRVNKKLKAERRRVLQKTELLTQTRNTLEAIIKGTSSVVGETFFASLVECLASVLNMRFAFVAEIDSSDFRKARTIAFWNGEMVGENFSYDICGTPCENVIKKRISVFSEKVAEYFPDDVWLKQNAVESYVGIPLSDSQGQFLGHMGVMDVKPIDDPDFLLSLLKVFAARAASEMERRCATEQLERKTEALQQSNADLEQFAYSVSHDMRQPLRSIIGHLQFLANDLKGKLDEDSQLNFNFVLEGAKRMDAMIMSLLEFSRVGRKTEAMRRVESLEVLNESLDVLAAIINESKAIIDIDGEWPQVYASPDEMIRLFQNLIGNAVKYCEGHKPHLEITSKRENSIWQVRIKDNGIGIDPAQIDRLFAFFSRLQPRTRFEGTGMGLALCRRIVEHHGGRIWAESKGEGYGSLFAFEIPLEPFSIESKT
ncbi:MAG TPA: ATPase [Methylococcaceae bacterium]|nr:ATPase [Methylococcaceae bacterium]